MGMTEREQFDSALSKITQGWYTPKEQETAWQIWQASRATPADHSVPVAWPRLTDEMARAFFSAYNIAHEHRGAYESVLAGYMAMQKAPQSDAQSVRDAWISVDERLPEQHEWVLVSDGTWSAIGMHLDDEDLEPNKRWMDESAELIESTGIKITHWMPMPAPPQKPVSDEVKP
jgi:hypothetical protein